MKNKGLWIGIIVAAVLLAVFAMGGGEEPNDNQGSGTVDKGDAGNIGEYSLTIDSCRLAEDYDGKPVVIVKYTFKNINDDDPAAFYLTFDDHVYQNGVGLNEAYFLDDSANYNADNQTKEIRKGASIEVEVAYVLNDTSTKIEVEVEELLSFSDKKVTKTFSIA
ncbi:MAG: DUF5067 domain-containing protein [Ruminococcaceae bacterium]|nr:DUF5067 domain-containing protein [Oscillospiraceae bacterium]